MDRVGRGFDRLAAVYDVLALVVYGNSLRRAQIAPLPQCGNPKRVLVVGGGSGWFLEAMLQVCKPQQVVYVELSGRMLELSEARIVERLPAFADRVNYFHGTLHELPPGEFDLVCTPFFLDLFDPAGLAAEVAALRTRLGPSGRWLVADFRHPAHWPMRAVAACLIWLMYRFFRLTCNIPARRLPDIQGTLTHVGMRSIWRKDFYGRMIRGEVWGISDGKNV